MPTRPGHWPDQLATVRIGPGVGGEAREHVVGILPDGLGDDERHVAVDRGEHVEPLAGAGDEAVAARPRHRVAAVERPAGARRRPRRGRFSSACWAGQQTRLASSRRSPLATSTRAAAGRRETTARARWPIERLRDRGVAAIVPAADRGRLDSTDSTGTILVPSRQSPCPARPRCAGSLAAVAGMPRTMSHHAARGTARVTARSRRIAAGIVLAPAGPPAAGARADDVPPPAAPAPAANARRLQPLGDRRRLFRATARCSSRPGATACSTGRATSSSGRADGTRLGDLAGHPTAVWAVKVSTDGKLAATAGYDGLVKLWDLPRGRSKHDLKKHKGWVRSLAFSPDGTRLATAGEDGTVVLWDTGRRQRGEDDRRPRRARSRRRVLPRRADARHRRRRQAREALECRATAPRRASSRDTATRSGRSPIRPTAAGSRRPARTARSSSGRPSDSKEFATLAGHKDWVTSLAFSRRRHPAGERQPRRRGEALGRERQGGAGGPARREVERVERHVLARRKHRSSSARTPARARCRPRRRNSCRRRPRRPPPPRTAAPQPSNRGASCPRSSRAWPAPPARSRPTAS